MIVQETFDLNGKQFVRTYSDEHRYVVGGVPYGTYDEAIDPAEYGRNYVEGDIIEGGTDPNEATAEDYEAALSELGVTV